MIEAACELSVWQVHELTLDGCYMSKPGGGKGIIPPHQCSSYWPKEQNATLYNWMPDLLSLTNVLSLFGKVNVDKSSKPSAVCL